LRTWSMRNTKRAALGLRSAVFTGALDKSDARILEVRTRERKALSSRQLQDGGRTAVNGARGNAGHSAALIGAS
jgi:hypothetical protein